MGNYQSAADAIRARLVTWAASAGATLVWDGFNAPQGEATTPPANATWCRPSIAGAGSRWASLGGSGGGIRARNRGLLVLQVFVPKGTGDAVGPALCDSFLEYFERWTSSPLAFVEKGEASPIGPDPAGRPFYLYTATAPFRRDEVRT